MRKHKPHFDVLHILTRNDKLRRLYNMDEVEKEAEKWRNKE